MLRYLTTLLLPLLLCTCDHAEYSQEKTDIKNNSNLVLLDTAKAEDLPATTNQVIPTPAADKLFHNYLRIKADALGEEEFLAVYNEDGSEFARFTGGARASFTFPQPELLSWQPDSFVVVLETDGRDHGRYPVRIGDGVKYIEELGRVTIFETPLEHLKTVPFSTTPANPLREKPAGDAKAIRDDYRDMRLTVVEQRGDWSLVKCVPECRPCPPAGEAPLGWLRTLVDDKAVVRFAYDCLPRSGR